MSIVFSAGTLIGGTLQKANQIVGCFFFFFFFFLGGGGGGKDKTGVPTRKKYLGAELRTNKLNLNVLCLAQ